MTFEFGGAQHTVPTHAAIGVIGDEASGVDRFLAHAGVSGQIVVVAYDLDKEDALSRARKARELEVQRRAGSAILIASHNDDVLRQLSDEIWWIRDGVVVHKGDPREVMEAHARHVAECVRTAATGTPGELRPSLRRGDGRAELASVETLNAEGQMATVWISGEPVSVRIAVVFREPVEEPVVGMMIRTRIGFEVYGTNTELEKVKVGPCGPGDRRTVSFSFRCDLCPGEYTLTAASHDPDGVWHDWLEDAVAFSVVDARYTAGVANLHAQVTVVCALAIA